MSIDAFRTWCATAPVPLRQEAAVGFARGLLSMDADNPNRDLVLKTLMCCLDDPAVLVRQAMAVELSETIDAPKAVILRLVADVPEVGVSIFASSPLLRTAHLLDGLRRGEPVVAEAIASRSSLEPSLVDWILDHGCVAGCKAIALNRRVQFNEDQMSRAISRLVGQPGALEALFERKTATVEQQCIGTIRHAKALQDNPLVSGVMANNRLGKTAHGATDGAVLEILANADLEELNPVVERLSAESALTPAFVLRASLYGRIDLLETIVGFLANVPVERVRNTIVNPRPAMTSALLKRTALHASVREVVTLALVLAREFAREGLTWDDWFFAEAMEEMLEQQVDAEENSVAKVTLDDAVLALCEEICAEISLTKPAEHTLFDEVDFSNLPTLTADEIVPQLLTDESKRAA